MSDEKYAVLSNSGRYTTFEWNNKIITFLHGKDLIKYLSVREWDDGYMVVDCLGKIKGEYEDYIDLPYILEKLYMDPQKYLAGVKGVRIKNA